MERIKVVFTGVAGKMGRDILAGIIGEQDVEIVGAVDVNEIGTDIGCLIGQENYGVKISSDLEKVLLSVKPDVMLDLTNHQVVMGNIRQALAQQVACVIGTSGINEEEVSEIRALSKKNKDTAVLIAPNFAVGALLMMRFSAEAAKFFPHVEIIEKHHDEKLDAPSGTALKTLEMISEVRKPMRQGVENEVEKIKGCRGAEEEGVHLHSVRLPGFVASQEVIFGGQGQTLTIQHDSLNRTSFVPGVLLALRSVVKVKEVIYGLDKVLW